MLINHRLLEIIGRRMPSIYDVIPRGPQSRYSYVALNPRPLPPHELGSVIASEFIHMVWLANCFNLDPMAAFRELDDLCPVPLKMPRFPPSGPPIPKPEPDPGPDWFIDFHLGFAARLAVTAVDSKDTPIGQACEKAIDRSLETIKSIGGL